MNLKKQFSEHSLLSRCLIEASLAKPNSRRTLEIASSVAITALSSRRPVLPAVLQQHPGKAEDASA